LTKCLNCGHVFTGHFCNNCGQKADVERLDIRALAMETLHFFTHFEKGFVHTSVQFVKRPGGASVAYLRGKRRQFQTPVSYLLIWTGLYILLHNFIIHYHNYHVAAGAASLEDQANALLRTHLTPFIFIILLISALIIYPLLARPMFNFGEVLVLSMYGGGTYFMLLFLSDLVLGLLFKINTITPSVFFWQTSVAALYNLWFLYSIFKKAGLRWLLFRIILIAFIISGIGLLLLLYLPLLWLRIVH